MMRVLIVCTVLLFASVLGLSFGVGMNHNDEMKLLHQIQVQCKR